MIDRFKRKKVEERKEVQGERSITEFEEFLSRDEKTYRALYSVMFLDPRRINVSMSEALKKAERFEKGKEPEKARIWCEIAGGLAIYEGDLEKTKECFKKCTEISPEKEYSILEDPEKAVAKAQEYYKKYLKD